MSNYDVMPGAVGFVVALTITDDGVAVDLSAATKKEFLLQKPNGTVLIKSASFVTSGTDGKLQYTTIAGDIDIPGTYRVQAYTEAPSFTGYSTSVEFVAGNNIAFVGAITLRTHYTLNQVVTSSVSDNLASATKLWMAVKPRTRIADNDSLVLIEKTDGLTRLNQAVHGTPAHGSIAVTGSAGAWSILIHVEEAATALLAAGTYFAELKALIGGNTVAVWAGNCVVSDGIVQAYS